MLVSATGGAGSGAGCAVSGCSVKVNGAVPPGVFTDKNRIFPSEALQAEGRVSTVYNH